MSTPRELLHRLLDYIREQANEVDPRAYRLSAIKDFLRMREELAGLPGVESDLKVEGDHIWLRIRRLLISKPPRLSDNVQGLIKVSFDPDGPTPSLVVSFNDFDRCSLVIYGSKRRNTYGP